MGLAHPWTETQISPTMSTATIFSGFTQEPGLELMQVSSFFSLRGQPLSQSSNPQNILSPQSPGGEREREPTHASPFASEKT